jgi:hypothetical protein
VFIFAAPSDCRSYETLGLLRLAWSLAVARLPAIALFVIVHWTVLAALFATDVGTVSAEIPVGSRWCEIRQTVFGWTTQKFPFGVKTAHALKIREPHVITVTGKAFYDIGHAPADHSNRRSTPKGYAVWEIHPVMKMEVIP